MKVRVARGVLLAASVIALAALLVGAAATAATPIEGTVGPASGSSTAWDFGPVGPGVSSGGTIEFLCAPVYCDSFELTVSLPAQDQEFYLTHKAILHIDYTWTSSQPCSMWCNRFCWASCRRSSQMASSSPTVCWSGRARLIRKC